MFGMEITTRTTNSNKVIMVTETIKVGPMFCLKIGNFLQGTIEVAWRRYVAKDDEEV